MPTVATVLLLSSEVAKAAIGMVRPVDNDPAPLPPGYCPYVGKAAVQEVVPVHRLPDVRLWELVASEYQLIVEDCYSHAKRLGYESYRMEYEPVFSKQCDGILCVVTNAIKKDPVVFTIKDVRGKLVEEIQRSIPGAFSALQEEAQDVPSTPPAQQSKGPLEEL